MVLGVVGAHVFNDELTNEGGAAETGEVAVFIDVLNESWGETDCGGVGGESGLGGGASGWFGHWRC